MIRQEEIKALKEFLSENKDSEIKIARSFLEDIVDYFENQHKIGEWIPCSERLPNRFEDVLLWYKGKIDGGTCDGEEIQFYGIGYLTADSWVISTYKSIKRERYVIAWQPLPEPYREDKENEN